MSKVKVPGYGIRIVEQGCGIGFVVYGPKPTMKPSKAPAKRPARKGVR